MEIENKKPETTGFITTPEFDRFRKVNFDASFGNCNSYS